ncbi:unnamed protein product, partial [Mesorhabditis belari]|uniref:VWFA domain-containing protein n=1 Tax=Mesorhabditis belari TaxID=2138241 RepID=A0AAF3ENC5_9BILA
MSLKSILVLILFAFARTEAGQCPALTGENLPCVSHVMIAIDASNYMIDQSLALRTIDFVSNTLMPKWSSMKKTITTDIYNCAAPDETKAYDFVILFTANNNQSDITKSSWFSKQQPTLVVNLGKGDYSSWVSEGGATILCNSLDYDDTQADRIIDSACGRITGEDQCHGGTKLIPSSTQVPDDQSSICDCDITKSWNDIMIVIDSSSAMGNESFNQLREFILRAMSEITISKSEPYSTRVGVVSYADSSYGDIHGMGTEVLKQMASDGFYIDATPGQFPDFKQLTKMICDANCFCPGQQQDGYFPVVRDGESWPSQGCYWDSSLTSIQPLVNRTCSTLVSAAGVTAMPNTIIKQRSLIGGAAQNLTKPAFFIGLQRVANVWKWDDGTAYEGGDIYGAGDCSTLRQGSGFNTNITAVDCHEGYYYACQTKPCTSSYYCE